MVGADSTSSNFDRSNVVNLVEQGFLPKDSKEQNLMLQYLHQAGYFDYVIRSFETLAISYNDLYNLDATVSYVNSLARIGKTDKAQQIIYQVHRQIEEISAETEMSEFVYNKLQMDCLVDTALAFIYWIVGDISSGLNVIQKYVNVINQLDLVSRFDLRVVSAILKNDLGSFQLALEYIEDALKISLKMEDYYRYAYAYLTIGNIMMRVNFPLIAKHNYELALKYFNELESPLGIAAATGGLAEVYAKANDLTNAIELMQKSLYLNQQINNLRNIATSLKSLAYFFIYNDNTSKAIEHLEQAIQVFQQLGNRVFAAQTSVDLILLKYDNIGDIIENLTEEYEVIYETAPVIAASILLRIFLLKYQNLTFDQIDYGYYLKEFDRLMMVVDSREKILVGRRKNICDILLKIKVTENKKENLALVLSNIGHDNLDYDLSLTVLMTILEDYLGETRFVEALITEIKQSVIIYHFYDLRVKLLLFEIFINLMKLNMQDLSEEQRDELIQTTKYYVDELGDYNYISNTPMYKLLVSEDLSSLQFFGNKTIQEDLLESYLKYTDDVKEVYSIIFHDINNLLLTNQLSLEVMEAGSMDQNTMSEFIKTSRMRNKDLADLIVRLRDMNVTEPSGPIDIVQEINELILKYQFLIQEKRLILNFNQTGSIDHSAGLVMQRILENLFSNAIKYTPDGGWITIQLDNRDDCVVLNFQNQGVIPPSEHEKVFKKYYRFRSSVEKRIGSGLGLHFCKNAIAQLGGEISLNSPLNNQDDGVEFTIVLPKLDR